MCLKFKVYGPFLETHPAIVHKIKQCPTRINQHKNPTVINEIPFPEIHQNYNPSKRMPVHLNYLK
jgi:hypothetical protein